MEIKVCGEQIQRFRIEKKGVRYVMGGRNFDCLNAVIERFIINGKTGYQVEYSNINENVQQL